MARQKCKVVSESNQIVEYSVDVRKLLTKGNHKRKYQSDSCRTGLGNNQFTFKQEDEMLQKMSLTTWKTQIHMCLNTGREIYTSTGEFGDGIVIITRKIQQLAKDNSINSKEKEYSLSHDSAVNHELIDYNINIVY